MRLNDWEDDPYCNDPYSPYFGELKCMIPEDYNPDDWEVIEKISENGATSTIDFIKKENKDETK